MNAELLLDHYYRLAEAQIDRLRATHKANGEIAILQEVCRRVNRAREGLKAEDTELFHVNLNFVHGALFALKAITLRDVYCWDDQVRVHEEIIHQIAANE